MNFLEFRKKHNLTQTQAGRLIGLSDGSWWSLERGKKSFSEGEEIAIKRILASFEAGGWEKVNTEPVTAQTMKDFRDSLNLSNIRFGRMLGCSSSHVSNMVSGQLEINKRYQLAFNSLLWEAANKSQKEQEPLEPPAEVLPVIQQTEYLQIREFESQRVLTFEDIAAAYQVDVRIIMNVFNDNRERWKTQPEDGSLMNSVSESFQVEVDTPQGKRKKRLFNLRGASRFAFHLRSGLAETIQDHCLDLLEQEAVGKKEPVQEIPTNPLDHLKLIVQAMEQSQAKVLELAAKIERVETQLEQLPQSDPEKTTADVLNKLACLNERKARLHELVNSIVNQAKALPQDDPEAQYYSKYGNTWRTVHRYARPLVSAKSDYTSLEQIAHSISGAELILARLGGRVPAEQLALEGVA